MKGVSSPWHSTDIILKFPVLDNYINDTLTETDVTDRSSFYLHEETKGAAAEKVHLISTL